MSTRYSIMLIITVVLCAYYPAIYAPINTVDDPGMYSLLLNTDHFAIKSIFFPGGSGSYYRPILLLSFLVDKYVWGLEESFMHLDNILIHICNSLLVYFIVRRSLFSEHTIKSYYPLAAAFLFALHPINTESVSWISGRTDPLAAFFLLLSMLVLLTENSLVGSCVSSIFLLVACLAKETAIFFLPAAVLFPFYFQGAGISSPPLLVVATKFRYHFVLFSVAGFGYFLIRMLAFSQGDQGVARVVTHIGGEQSIEKMTSFVIMLKTIGFYCKKLFVPFPLSFGITHVSDAYVWLGAVALLLCIYLFTHRILPAFYLLCTASVASSALLIILIRFTWTPLAERYMYIPSSFFVVGLTLAVERWPLSLKYRKLLLIATVVLTLIAFYGCFTRNLLWQNNYAFFSDTLKKSPDFMPAQNEIATALIRQGKLHEALGIFNSFKDYGDVINYQYGLINKAGAMADSGDFVGARKILNEVLKTPGKLELQILEKMLELNKVEMLRGKTTETAIYVDSVKHLTRLYELTGNPFYEYRLGVTHLHEKNNAQALQALSIVTKTAPPDAYYRKPAEKLAKDLAK